MTAQSPASEPAFPVKVKRNTSSDPLATPREIQFPGMTLRDWFAGQALAGLCGAFAIVNPKPGETREQADARWCYARADAMLTERTNHGPR